MLKSASPGLLLLRSSKRHNRVVKKNAGASLVDLGDGVLCVEFHSKMNAIGGDTIQMLHAGLREASANFTALVVGNEGEHFSAGANIMLLLLEAQEENWDEVDLMVRAFQGATMALRYADVPVIVAPAGLALGGGCEDRAARRSRAGGRRELHRSCRSGRRTDTGRRRHERDGGARGRTDAAGLDRLSSADSACVRGDRFREGIGKRARRAASRLSASARCGDDESGAADCRCEGAGAAACRRRVPAAGAADGHSRWRRRGARAVEARDPSRLARGTHQRSRCAHRSKARDDHGGRRASASVNGHRAGAARPRARGVSQSRRRSARRRNASSTR